MQIGKFVFMAAKKANTRQNKNVFFATTLNIQPITINNKRFRVRNQRKNMIMEIKKEVLHKAFEQMEVKLWSEKSRAKNTRIACGGERHYLRQ